VLYGLYLPWLLLLCGLGLALSWALRRVLAAAGFYRWVWHPALFDLALYALVVWALAAASSSFRLA
jgi:protein-S-isoprenylcysteine O-methyltransferase Ste14